MLFSMILTHTFIIRIINWSIRIIMLVAIPQKQRPATATAWLLMIFLWPKTFLVIYLIFGSTLLAQKQLKKYIKISKLEKIKYEDADFDIDQNELSSLANKLGSFPALYNNKIKLIDNSIDMMNNIIKDIDGAKEEVNILYYIFSMDKIGTNIINALKNAVNRGVTCRLLVDGVGSSKLIKHHSKNLLNLGIKFHNILPPKIIKLGTSRMDMRNHRKLTIIDGLIGYTGSHNISEESYGKKNMIWHDLSIRIEGEVVGQLNNVFCEDWFFETNEVLKNISASKFKNNKIKNSKLSIQTLPSGPNYKTQNYQRLVVAALYQSKKKVIITTPYFVPDDAFLQALEVAVLNGVKVQLIVPKRFDQILVGFATKSYYNDLLKIGVEIYLFKDGLIHSKTMSIDDKILFFGSSNFDIRSFALNFEINLILNGDIKNILKKQNEYLHLSKKLTYKSWNKLDIVRNSMQSVAKLFSPLL